jgi:hypothetical protein
LPGGLAGAANTKGIFSRQDLPLFETIELSRHDSALGCMPEKKCR